MSLQNLREDYLYSLLPEGIISLDEQGLIMSVLGGYQDRVDDLRAYTAKLELLVTAQGLPETDVQGNPAPNAVIMQVQSPQGKIYPRSLEIHDDTPAPGDPTLFAWGTNQLQLDEDHVALSAAYGVDPLRLVDANIMGYLADTVGAVLYTTAAQDPNNAFTDARRLLSTWFPRLQFKGTAESFEALGRILGFDDVRMTPLWGRLSPRIPNDVGDPRNDPDFSTIPDYYPKQIKDLFYDPWVLDDGPFFAWSGTVSTHFGTNDPSFYTQVVNGFNPFVSVVQTGTSPNDPISLASPYYLVGGGPETKATVAPTGSELLFQAISAGSSFNGLAINFEDIVNGTYRIMSIEDKLSAIKYRTSYFDLGMTMDFDHAANAFGTNIAQPNKYLSDNPTGANFGATALSPYRPWINGSIIYPLVHTDFVFETQANGAASIYTARTQADLTTRELNQEGLATAGAQLLHAFEEVRPATRTPRHSYTGYLINDQVGYAEFCAMGSLATLDHLGTYWGTLTGYPLPPYQVDFEISNIPLVEESDPNNPNYITINGSAIGLPVTGTYNYSNSTWQLIVNGLISVPSDVFLIEPITGAFMIDPVDGAFIVEPRLDANVLYAAYFPTSTEVVRYDPSHNPNCVADGYQMRPEDDMLTLTTNGTNAGTAIVAYDMPDEYPWRREYVGGGELIDVNTYYPPGPDIATVPLGQSIAVVAQTGAQYDVLLNTLGDQPPHFQTQARDLDNYVPGQMAIAYTGTFKDLNIAGTGTGFTSGYPSGDIKNLLTNGTLFHFGLVQGVLVADAPKFFGKHHSEALALWLPFNEHSMDDLQFIDHSVIAGNPSVRGLNPTDRKFDPVQGWYLSAQPGLNAVTAAARGFTYEFAGGFWLRALNSYDNQIFQNGPFEILLENSAPNTLVSFYLADTLLTSKSIGPDWTYLSWSFNGSLFQSDFFNLAGTLGSTITIPWAGTLGTEDDFSDFTTAIRCGTASYDIRDLRLWSEPKTKAQRQLSSYHNPTPTAVLYPPAWLESSNNYDRYGARVLPNGYIVPDLMPTSSIYDQQAWVQRYDYLARYFAQERYKEVGLGSGNMPPTVHLLGLQWDSMTGAGTNVVSTWQGGFLGVNDAWLFDNPKDKIVTLHGTDMTANGIPATLVSTGTANPWPNPMVATNPCRDRIWVLGDDGKTWDVTVQKDSSGVASLVATKVFTLNGSEQPTGAHTQLSSGTSQLSVKLDTSYAWLLQTTLHQVNVRVFSAIPHGLSIGQGIVITGAAYPWLNGTWQVINVINPTEFVYQLSSTAPASVGDSSSTIIIMPPQTVVSSGTVYAAHYSGTNVSAPLFMYGNEETDVAFASNLAVLLWANPNSFGMSQTPAVPALPDNGQIAFDIGTPLPPGNYEITITSGNIGRVDDAFSGFHVIITVGDVPFEAVLCQGKKGADFTQTDTFQFVMPHSLPGFPSSWILSFDWTNALRDTRRGTARQMKISSVSLIRHATTLYKVSLVSGTVTITGPLGTNTSDFPLTPGGWLAELTSWGTYTNFVHESALYSSDDTVTSNQPYSNVLTATTPYRREDLILTEPFLSSGAYEDFETLSLSGGGNDFGWRHSRIVRTYGGPVAYEDFETSTLAGGGADFGWASTRTVISY